MDSSVEETFEISRFRGSSFPHGQPWLHFVVWGRIGQNKPDDTVEAN